MSKIIRLAPSGNSRAARLPKPFLDQLEITDRVEIAMVDQAIVITKPREISGSSLGEMLHGVTPQGVVEQEWGGDVGAEIVADES